MFTGRSDGDISENDFVDGIMRRFAGHGSTLTTSVKNDADWEKFTSATFSQKVNPVELDLLDSVFHVVAVARIWLSETFIDQHGYCYFRFSFLRVHFRREQASVGRRGAKLLH